MESKLAVFPWFFGEVKGRYPSELSITHLADLFKSSLSCCEEAPNQGYPVLIQIQIMQMQ